MSMEYVNLVERARFLRTQIETNASSMNDEDALEAVELFPNWSGEGVIYNPDMRVRYENVLYKVLQYHTSQSDWNPVSAPSLFAKVLIPDPDVIPEWEQPGATNPYMKGDKVMYQGQMYECLIDNNVWSPVDYSFGWQLITE